MAAVQTTEDGKPVVMCLSQRPFTKDSIQAFAEKSLAAPATLVSDGLGCFTAVQGTGILHEPHVTGGGASSAKHPSFRAVNTALGNIKTSLSGTYHAFAFKKYGQRYLGQIQYIFNRRYNLRTILLRLARDAAQAAPRIRREEPSRRRRQAPLSLNDRRNDRRTDPRNGSTLPSSSTRPSRTTAMTSASPGRLHGQDSPRRQNWAGKSPQQVLDM